MNACRMALVVNLLLGAGLAHGTGKSPLGLREQIPLADPTKGQVQTDVAYVCPNTPRCPVTVRVTPPAAPNSQDCEFTLTGDDNQPFFYIYRNADRPFQTIVWNLVSADAGWSAAFTTRAAGRGEGIHFTEGGDHANQPSGTPTQQRRSILQSGVGNRRSILLYDIDVTLSRGAQTIACKPFGPAILNRGN